MIGEMHDPWQEQTVTIARGFRYKLEPLPEQGVLFRQFAGVCRLV